ncbi:hypothetical protein [Deinococcus arenicola]|uniref:DUF669 domain-containing protein n=1 Tax=Deinococcus arenicola TaxID=2994950 RepID=A0ABU4DVJ3_9DEIO|nr:hypothetical protein [Deinococcus sp. ZS9-10]MDV6376464.1 hypothetical protein [Deinococcus sp. ZS9-10]
MALQGQANAGGDYERTLFPEGLYTMTLTKAMVMWGKPSQYAPEGSPKIAMIWEYDDGEGNKFELMDYLSFPKNFGYNEKSKFWKRVGEIAGAPINKDNVGAVGLDLGEFIQSYDELIEHIRSTNDQGRAEKADVLKLTVAGQELMGKACQLVVKVWSNDGKEGNEVASVMQVGEARKPMKPAAKAPAQQNSKPPARPVQPAQAPAPVGAADMPF